MKWGVRRSKERLLRKSEKLTNENEKLQTRINKLNKDAYVYRAKSIKVSKSNTRSNRALAKATAKKAKFDYKIATELNKRDPSDSKLEKYNGESQKQNLKILKLKRKIKSNKWAQKAEDTEAMIKNAKYDMDKNERVVKMLNNTVNAMDAGTIKQGRLFMQYVIE